jgi:murein DD-endopeptidase MepM/ murein hydrolase activator NlpD
MSLLTSGGTPTTELPAATVGVVWFDVPLEAPADLPARIEHEVTVSVPPGLPVPASITAVGAAVEVDRTPPPVIGPPLQGPGWMAVGSCCDGPHRRSVQPIDGDLWLAQRFAIDFNRIAPVDGQDQLANGDPGQNASWFTYDQPVLAVGDAEVVVAVDRFPDQVPDAPQPVTIEEADGNAVILRLADGVYAFYAHLEPGSVSVEVGDRVRTGDVLGRTGNSGSSTGPHLHFQLMDQPSALRANGLPYAFDAFTVTGRGPDIAALLALDPAADRVPVDPVNAGPRRDELPLGRDVVDFAG